MRAYLLILFLGTAAAAEAQEVWPTNGWTTATPQQMGMDAAKLNQARNFALQGGGSGHITRSGRLVLSWGSATQTYDLKSTTKSIGVTAVGLAIKDGRVSLGDKAQQHHPNFGVPPNSNAATGWLDDITLRHLASQTAGFEKPGGYEPLLFQPGTQWHYSDGGPNWLAECITLNYGQDLNTVMFNRVFAPLGITASDLSWRNNAYRPDTINGIKNREFGSGISANVDAMARVGHLYLRGGRWSTGQILQQSFVDACRTTVPGVPGLPVRDPANYGNASDHYGLLWWNNADGTLADVPNDAYWSWGLYDSWIIVIPSLDIVASRAGDTINTGFATHYDRIKPFIEPIATSVTGAPPPPPPPGSSSKVWIAAKSGSLAGLMAKSGDYAAGSLAGQLVYPNLNVYNTGNTTQSDAVTFNVILPSTGTWYLWARMYYPGTTAQPTNDPNSFWVSVDGGTAKTLGNLTTQDRTWHWDGSAGALLSLGSLNGGDHVVRIWNREARETTAAKLSPRLDVVLLTNDASYVPRDTDVSLPPSGGGGGTGAPYPNSASITGLTWAPVSSIVRKAPGCDTWPLTWADDDNLYGAYGDGNGFEPQLSTKLSLGFARVSGPATGFTGTNIRSASGEHTGDGAAGKKASGMLMVGGVLYMWVRNADNNGNQSQLAWSSDRGATWTWSSWKFAEFGYPTFVNYGKNYAGARDAFVYTISHDNPSAYNESDRFILMRVSKDRIRDRAAYEFFRGRDASGNPLWTPDVTQRTAVFTHAGRCRRSGISYNAGLGRYLWWQMNHVDGQDNRFAGGFGVYDAPEPWGPWTTVYYTANWDVGPGETGSFPPKWMSSDGKTIHLVFSGDDTFAVRQATLTTSGGGGGGGGFGVRIDFVSTGRPYSTATARAGALPYIDRSYTVGSLSSALNNGVLIRTANDDKYVPASTHLTITVTASANLYVAYDKRATTSPTWLQSGWTLTSDAVATSDSGASPLRVYRKAVSAGSVTLGGNHQGGATGAHSSYFVIVQPATAVAAWFTPSLPEDAWDHAGDADGDGLLDTFEAANFTDPALADTDGDGDPDEAELDGLGRTLWDVQEASVSPSGTSGDGDGSGGCGATGLEAVVVFALLALRRLL